MNIIMWCFCDFLSSDYALIIQVLYSYTIGSIYILSGLLVTGQLTEAFVFFLRVMIYSFFKPLFTRKVVV